MIWQMLVYMSENEAKDNVFHQILPTLEKEARKVYLENLQWIRNLRKDPMYQKVMESKRRLIDEDEFDSEEATEAAVQKRKHLLTEEIFNEVDEYDDDTEID